jgi:hypothetical protein
LKIKLLILFLIISSCLFAQKERLDILELQLRDGNLEALLEIGEYFDSKIALNEYLGHHIINSNESSVAKRLVLENTMFLKSEIDIDSTTTSADFKMFLKKNENSITFSKLASAFLIIPFDQRETNFEIIELTDYKWSHLKSTREELLSLDWVISNKVDSLLNAKNPLALLKTASVLLGNRYRLDEHHDNEDLINLIQLMTNSQIAVPNESGALSYHLEKDFYDQSKINLLIFFANHYKDYQWDDSINSFSNNQLIPKPVAYEAELFEMLASNNDTLAQNAFIKLTKTDVKRVSDLSDQYRKADISENYILPTFPFRFLKQLVQLTDYSTENDINFEGSNILKNQIELLKTDLTFKDRKILEDILVQYLTLEEITAFEYWSLIYEKSWSLTYSAGRILDKFYSKNWSKLTSNPKHLETYLLKAKLFQDLGIIGYCNNYLVKFQGSSQDIIASIQNINSTNLKVKDQIEKAITIAEKPIKFVTEEKKNWKGNTPIDIKNFKTEYTKIIGKKQDSTELEDDISFLLSQINYDQIGEALKAIENIPIRPYQKYSFISRDFGFSYVGNFEKTEIRNEFLKNYQKLTESELHAHYLEKAGVDIMNPNNKIDFDKVYEVLKYDVKKALAGGGGSTEDNVVYSVIKILEKTFETTLGYANKLCCSDNMYACNSQGSAMEWMNYLKINNLLTTQHNEPVSFIYE